MKLFLFIFVYVILPLLVYVLINSVVGAVALTGMEGIILGLIAINGSKKLGILSLVLGSLLILTSLINIDKTCVEYKSGQGYTIQQGCTIGGENNFALVEILKDSEILKEKEIMNFSPGQWLVACSDTSKFFIRKDIEKRIWGKIIYITFVYDGEKIKDLQDKKFHP